MKKCSRSTDRDFSIDKINEARAERFANWKRCLENPSENVKNKELASKLEKNKSLRSEIYKVIKTNFPKMTDFNTLFELDKGSVKKSIKNKRG